MIERTDPSVQVRITCFGTLAVEVRDEDGQWQQVQSQEWGGTTFSRRLLRFLLLHGRQARRSTCMEALWPDGEALHLEDYLNRGAGNLRRVFGRREVLTMNGTRTSYQLADQSVVWTDLDACEEALREAEQVGHTSAQGCRLLEMARDAFAGGSLFEEEDGLWCHAKRERLATAHYRCLLWLAEAYEAQGRLREAEAQLETLLQRVPLDEAVQVRLLRLLQRQGLIAEALRR